MLAAVSSIQEREIVRRLKSRDQQAMFALYDMYGGLVHSVILRAVANRATAEDITQEVFLRVWTRIHTFNEEKGNLEAWIVTIARNRAFDYLRSLRADLGCAFRVGLNDLEQAGFYSIQEDPAERLTRKRAVKEGLERLNRDQREVIELTHFEGMSQTEIARKLSKPLGTVKGLVRSALKVLRAAATGGVDDVRIL